MMVGLKEMDRCGFEVKEVKISEKVDVGEILGIFAA